MQLTLVKNPPSHLKMQSSPKLSETLLMKM